MLFTKKCKTDRSVQILRFYGLYKSAGHILALWGQVVPIPVNKYYSQIVFIFKSQPQTVLLLSDEIRKNLRISDLPGFYRTVYLDMYLLVFDAVTFIVDIEFQ